MKILQIAPIWEAVPPSAYGGTETVVDLLCKGLADNETNEVLLACSSDSKISHPRIRRVGARVPALRRQSYEDKKPHEWCYIAEALRVAVEEQVDIIHNHSGEIVMAFSPEGIPILTSTHCMPTPDTLPIWKHYRGNWNTISTRQRDAMPDDMGGRYLGAVHNGIDVASFPFEESPQREDYLLFLGRLSPEKGTHIAIQVARTLDIPIKVAAKRPDNEKDEYYNKHTVEPLLDDDKFAYVGEAGPRAKRQLYQRALATLVPIQWEEPFGLVIAESLACGTPVIAFARGATPEIIRDGITGYLVNDLEGMIAAVRKIDRIDPQNCRNDMLERFDAEVMTQNYQKLFSNIA